MNSKGIYVFITIITIFSVCSDVYNHTLKILCGLDYIKFSNTEKELLIKLHSMLIIIFIHGIIIQNYRISLLF